MNFLLSLSAIAILALSRHTTFAHYPEVLGVAEKTTCSSNNCITFNVGPGTGCAWMCGYCAEQLGTNNYYFTDGVCKYQSPDGCAGNPVAGTEYTCCSA